MTTSWSRSEFVLLTTFRRTGAPVPTPMWFVERDGRLLMSTPAGAGKLKRLRHTPEVRLQPCGRRGTPLEGTSPVDGEVRVVTDPAERAEVVAALLARYGWQWRAAQLVERVGRRVRRSEKAGAPRVALVATPRPLTEG